MSNTKSAKKRTVKTILKELDNNELIEIIIEMSKINPKNKQFLNAFIMSSEEIDFEKILRVECQKIYTFIWGRSGKLGRSSLKISKAKKIVNDFAKIYKDYTIHISELKLSVIECYIDFTYEYNYKIQEFIVQLLVLTEDFCNYVNKYSLINTYEDRVDYLKEKVLKIGVEIDFFKNYSKLES